LFFVVAEIFLGVCRAAAQKQYFNPPPCWQRHSRRKRRLAGPPKAGVCDGANPPASYSSLCYRYAKYQFHNAGSLSTIVPSLQFPIEPPEEIAMKQLFAKLIKAFAIVSIASTLSACGYNEFQTKDEATKAAWSEVVNQYQRRSDLIPNLVNTVKGYASHERETLEAVTKARAAATSFQITPEVLNNPEAFKKFQQVQGELSGALSRLMAVSENYPQLKADTSFRDLQSQLEGTENRITVARQRYIAAVQDYNVLTRSFPSNLTAMVMKYNVKPSFTVENEKAISSAPTVSFGK
jgi:LemA protein